jgi:hypothetical protein
MEDLNKFRDGNDSHRLARPLEPCLGRRPSSALPDLSVKLGVARPVRSGRAAGRPMSHLRSWLVHGGPSYCPGLGRRDLIGAWPLPQLRFFLPSPVPGASASRDGDTFMMVFGVGWHKRMTFRLCRAQSAQVAPVRYRGNDQRPAPSSHDMRTPKTAALHPVCAFQDSQPTLHTALCDRLNRTGLIPRHDDGRWHDRVSAVSTKGDHR